MDGAQADDEDAAFIMNILENKTLLETNALGKFAATLIDCCKNLDRYKNVKVQNVCVIGLLR